MELDRIKLIKGLAKRVSEIQQGKFLKPILIKHGHGRMTVKLVQIKK